MHSLLLCISMTGVVKYQLYERAVNAVRFSDSIAQLPEGSTVILDNAKIHKATNVLIRQGLPTTAQVAAQHQLTLSAPILQPSGALFQHSQNTCEQGRAQNCIAAERCSGRCCCNTVTCCV